jgi:acyl carrier protein
MNRQEIFTNVRSCVAETVHVAIDNIREDSKLVDELGIDSIDLLDLTFQLEQRFNIQLSPGEFANRAKEKLGDTPFEIKDVYTPKAMEYIRSAMPEVPLAELPDGLTRQELPRRFRVATMVNLVEKALGALEKKNG